MGNPTTEQVAEVVADALWHMGIDSQGEQVTDAVMKLLAEMQPKVLCETTTQPWEYDRHRSLVVAHPAVTPGTRVAVVLVEGTADRVLSVLRTGDDRIRKLAEGTADSTQEPQA